MEWLSEDPTYLAGGLAVLAGAFLIALKVTQQGKYLVWAAAALGGAALAVAVEWLWVTDNERIEETVYRLARAVAASDVPATLAALDGDVRLVYNSRRGGGTLSVPTSVTRAFVEHTVSSARFDFLRITRLRANAGAGSRRGTAELEVLCGGSIEQGGATYNFGSTNSAWSLGLREASPGVWKVNRISPVRIPSGASFLPH
jgi:hypothetical protein